MMREDQIDLAFVQEPYILHNATYVSGNVRIRSALLVNNKEIDVVLITQLSDGDCIVGEISHRNLRCME